MLEKKKRNIVQKLNTEVKKKMYKFLELEGKSVHFCERLIIKKYKRFNNQWKLEIIKFKTPNLEEIYQSLEKQDAERHILYKNLL